MANVVAKSDCSIMITGETGTGKEVLAKYIHKHSRRAEAPMVTVNGAALPEALAEAELFGYERGSFTGARAEGYGGLFAAADGGTLFLDEVGELPLAVQAKLLRVLDSGEVRRVGSAVSRRVNVRVIAATNRDLEEMVRVKSFRGDLFYRLNVLPLEIRPLRERPEDVVALAMKFWRDACRKYDVDIEINMSTLRSLTTRQWPGNVRELKHYIEREVVKTQAKPNFEALRTFAQLNSNPEPFDILEMVEIGGPLRQVLSQVEENYIRYMLGLCNGEDRNDGRSPRHLSDRAASQAEGASTRDARPPQLAANTYPRPDRRRESAILRVIVSTPPSAAARSLPEHSRTELCTSSRCGRAPVSRALDIEDRIYAQLH